MNSDALKVLIRLYSSSDSKTIITDTKLNVLWTSCDDIPKALTASMFSTNNILPLNDRLFPVKSEKILYFNTGFCGYTAKVTPMLSDDILVISLFEPIDILKNSVFSSTSAGIQNTFSQIREAITQIYSAHLILKEKIGDNEQELYSVFKRLDNSCYNVLGSLANYTELFLYAQGVDNECVFDAGGFTNELCYLCQSVLRGQDISITCEADSQAPVRCNSDRFASALLNLIANGIAYNISEHKAVKVTVRVQNDEVLVSVWDNGLGITASELERSATPFGTGRLREGGSGLGLLVVREFAKSCGAVLTTSSSPDCGTGMHLRFKLAADIKLELRSPIKDSLGLGFSAVSIYLSKFL